MSSSAKASGCPGAGSSSHRWLRHQADDGNQLEQGVAAAAGFLLRRLVGHVFFETGRWRCTSRPSVAAT